MPARWIRLGLPALAALLACAAHSGPSAPGSSRSTRLAYRFFPPASRTCAVDVNGTATLGAGAGAEPKEFRTRFVATLETQAGSSADRPTVMIRLNELLLKELAGGSTVEETLITPRHFWERKGGLTTRDLRAGTDAKTDQFLAAIAEPLARLSFDATGRLLDKTIVTGHVLQAQDIDLSESILLFMPVLPARAVGIGDSWTGERPLALGALRLPKPLLMTYRLRELRPAPEGLVAVLELQGTLETTSATSTRTGKQVELGSLRYELSGSARFAIAEGRWLDTEMTLAAHGTTKEGARFMEMSAHGRATQQ